MICESCGGSLPAHDGWCAVCGVAVGSYLQSVESESVTMLSGEGLTTFRGPGLLSDAPPEAASSPPPSGTGPPSAEGSIRPNAGPLAPGLTFGTRYRIIKVLESGGMVAVYQAWDEE